MCGWQGGWRHFCGAIFEIGWKGLAVAPTEAEVRAEGGPGLRAAAECRKVRPPKRSKNVTANNGCKITCVFPYNPAHCQLLLEGSYDHRQTAYHSILNVRRYWILPPAIRRPAPGNKPASQRFWCTLSSAASAGSACSAAPNAALRSSSPRRLCPPAFRR